MPDKYAPVLIGQEDKKKIFIEYGEYLKIIKFAKAGAADGSRGVLLGRRENNCIYITKILEAVYFGGEGLESPAFSPESWGRINAEIKGSFPDLIILGQFSTHSPEKPQRIDYIMQEKYFSKTENLLFVFDPADNSEKMYEYDSREFVFLNGFYLYDKYDNPINLRLREALVRPLSREYEIRMRLFDDIKKKIRHQNNVYAVFLIIIMVLILYNIIYSTGLEKKLEENIFPHEEKLEWKNELKSLEKK